MRIIILTLLLFLSRISNIAAQNDYLVSTSTNQELPMSEEEQFIKQNFPLQLLCKWTPGAKFMFNPTGRDQYLPILSSCENKKEVDSKILRHKNENYIEVLLGFGDILQKYSGITDEHWAVISQGKLEEGMNAEECRLSIGNPIEIRLKKDTRFETWFYNNRTLEFENGTLQRFK